MRIYYNDEEQFPGQFALWRANTERQIRGPNGQAVLRELEAALVALPEKRLVMGAIAKDGHVCTVGLLLVLKRTRAGMTHAEAVQQLEQEYGDDDEPTDDIATREGVVPNLVAWRLVELNDILLDDATPEARYEFVLTWVRRKLCMDEGQIHHDW